MKVVNGESAVDKANTSFFKLKLKFEKNSAAGFEVVLSYHYKTSFLAMDDLTISLTMN